MNPTFRAVRYYSPLPPPAVPEKICASSTSKTPSTVEVSRLVSVNACLVAACFNRSCCKCRRKRNSVTQSHNGLQEVCDLVASQNWPRRSNSLPSTIRSNASCWQIVIPRRIAARKPLDRCGVTTASSRRDDVNNYRYARKVTSRGRRKRNQCVFVSLLRRSPFASYCPSTQCCATRCKTVRRREGRPSGR